MNDIYQVNTLEKMQPPKKASKIKAFLKRVFCKNIVIKIGSILFASLIWFLVVVLN